MKKKYYKDKGMKSCYIYKEEHTKTSLDDDKEVVEMVYVAIKEDLTCERYENENSLISHVTKNDSWIIDSGCSYHMTGDLSKFKEFDDGGAIMFGSDVPYLVKGKVPLMLNDQIRCNDAYWV